MGNVAIILLTFVAQLSLRELVANDAASRMAAANHTLDLQATDKLADKLVSRLVNQAFKVGPLARSELDHTIVGKRGRFLGPLQSVWNGRTPCSIPVFSGQKTQEVGKYDEWIAELSGDNYGQAHLFKGKSQQQKVAIALQLESIDKKVAGGLLGYIQRAQKLLADAKVGANPFEGLMPEVPAGQDLSGDKGPGSKRFAQYEKLGMAALGGCCFCLVAGGMGERLGYSGIKIELAPECVTKKPFLQLYIEHILAFRDYAREKTGNKNLECDFAIMTSSDTHQKTLRLLESNSYFGMPKECCTLMMQEKVPAMSDSNAKISLDKKSNVETKPHGHGDVHTLLHQKGLVNKWLQAGKTHVLFFQDTNPLTFRAFCALLGVSLKEDFAMNSVTVPRCAGEACGAICKLKSKDGTSLTINVEYNQLDALLKNTKRGGDVAGSNGFSPYPGNINVCLLQLKPYAAALDRTGGVMPEFVNPKYKDDTKQEFKKPTRLECMMQEFPRLCSKSDKIGFTQLDRFMCFTCVKNSIEEALPKVKKGQPADTALSAEADLYNSNVQLLKLAGCTVGPPSEVSWLGILADIGAKIVLAPSFAVSFEELKSKIKGKVKISSNSTLILEGDVVLRGLDLDGYLELKGPQVVKNMVVKNGGTALRTVEDVSKLPDFMQIRGYELGPLKE